MKHRKTISHGMAPRDRLELFGYPVDGQPHRRPNVTRIMQMVLTGALLIPSLVVILVPGFDGSTKQWAYGLTLGFLAEEMTTIAYRVKARKSSTNSATNAKIRTINCA